jgi:hypothetical protein
MRTTLNIDDELLERATALSGLREKTAVVRAGLEARRTRERKTTRDARRIQQSGTRSEAPASAAQPNRVILLDTSLMRTSIRLELAV